MQRWKAGQRYSITIVLNAKRVFHYTESRQGMYVNITGATTVPAVLPLQSLCDQINLVTDEGKGVVLFNKFRASGSSEGGASKVQRVSTRTTREATFLLRAV